MAVSLTEKIETMRQEMIEMFGEKLPNPEHEPKRFDYYVQLFLYQKSLKKEDERR